jgi:hypothetical protein
LPFDEVDRKTLRAREGVRLLAQRGIPGFEDREIARESATAPMPCAKKMERHCNPPPTTQIIHVGSGPEGTNRLR